MIEYGFGNGDSSRSSYDVIFERELYAWHRDQREFPPQRRPNPPSSERPVPSVVRTQYPRCEIVPRSCFPYPSPTVCLDHEKT